MFVYFTGKRRTQLNLIMQHEFGTLFGNFLRTQFCPLRQLHRLALNLSDAGFLLVMMIPVAQLPMECNYYMHEDGCECGTHGHALADRLLRVVCLQVSARHMPNLHQRRTGGGGAQGQNGFAWYADT